MKIDNAIKDFYSRYDKEAMKSIDDISSNRIFTLQKSTIDTFNMMESFNRFVEFMDGYCKYKIDNINNNDSTPNDTINKQVYSFIDTLIKPDKTLYSQCNTFIISYINEIKKLSHKIDEWKSDMMSNDVDTNSVSCINDFIDYFVDKINNEFYKSVDTMLIASGYTSKKKLFNSIGEKKQIFFL